MAVGNILESALSALSAGISIIPIAIDGSKKPSMKSWAEYQSGLPSQEDARRWFANPAATGLAVICGTVSGGLEALDVEEDCTWNALEQLVQDHDLSELWERMTGGYLEQAPGGGRHVLYRCEEVGRNAKLAQCLVERLVPMGGGKEQSKLVPNTLIEVRGEGGYAIVSPSCGTVHQTGRPYILLRGGLDSIATITPDERDAIHTLCRMLDEMPEPIHVNRDPTPRASGEERPGDRFNREADFRALLEKDGWTFVGRRGEEERWLRPGKTRRSPFDRTSSATLNHRGSGRLKVFSASTVLPLEGTLDPFGYLVHTRYAGDWHAATKALGVEYREQDKERAGVSAGMHAPIPPRHGTNNGPTIPEGASNAKKQRALIRPLSEVAPKPVNWLWRHMLALGKLHIFAGQPGDGKSTISAAIAAIGSRGGTWPDGTTAPMFRTLFVLGEDAPDDTLRPRLDLHNADVNSIFYLEAVHDEDGKERFFNITKHLDTLETAIVEHEIDLVVIDPLSSVMVGADRNSEGNTRDMLTPLAKLADRQNVAIIGIAHTGKPNAAKRTAQQQVLGSTGLVAIARVVWQTAQDEDGIRYFGPTKNNLARLAPALRWSWPEGEPIQWLGGSDRSIDEVLDKTRVQYMDLDDDSPKVTKTAAAEAFLQEELKSGMKPAAYMEREMERRGWGKTTRDTAKRNVGVKPWKETTLNGKWWWGLPSGTPIEASTDEFATEEKELVLPIHKQTNPFNPFNFFDAKSNEIDDLSGVEGVEEVEEVEGVGQKMYRNDQPLLPLSAHLRVVPSSDSVMSEPTPLGRHVSKAHPIQTLKPIPTDVAEMVMHLRQELSNDELAQLRREMDAAPRDWTSVEHAALAHLEQEMARSLELLTIELIDDRWSEEPVA